MKTKIKKILKIAIIIIAILIMDLLNIANCVQASNINSANLYSAGDCGTLLKYKGIDVVVTYVKYDNEGISYPAYCLDKTLPGITSEHTYSVDATNAVNDIGLWRRVINGYPYKSVSELGCATEQEAFTATKQAIYCYIHDNNLDDYSSVGEAGQRTLNALNMIVSNALNSNETKIANIISINKNSNTWTQDEKEKNYVSKKYKISKKADITNYNVSVETMNNELPKGLKIVDENNNAKTEFIPNEQFKIMIPIESLTIKGNLKINVQTAIKTKPVLYGSAPEGYQDYALSVAMYEDSFGNINDEYQKNETKLILIKQDENSNQNLAGVEFTILDENKKEVYTNLITDKAGKINIENILPGKYYIKETKTLDGYQQNEELTQIDLEYNQTTTVTINNSKTEKPKIETKKVASEVKRLPITGM